MKFLKYFILLGSLIAMSCNTGGSEDETEEYDSIPPGTAVDTVIMDQSMFSVRDSIKDAEHNKIFSNAIFRNVKISENANDAFEISGEAKLTGGKVYWVIEDGMNELQTGNAETGKANAEWGHFTIKVTAPKKNSNSTLHLIIFEKTTADKRQYELPLYLH